MEILITRLPQCPHPTAATNCCQDPNKLLHALNALIETIDIDIHVKQITCVYAKGYYKAYYNNSQMGLAIDFQQINYSHGYN